MQHALIKDGRVENVILADADFAAAITPQWDAVEALDTLREQGLGVGIGWHWDSENGFSAPDADIPTVLPKITITHCETEGADGFLIINERPSEITTRSGEVLLITAELHVGDVLVPIDDVFRMPIVSTDGRERVILAEMKQGVISMRIAMNESRIWKIDKAVINRDLPSEKHMDFDGVTVFVVE